MDDISVVTKSNHLIEASYRLTLNEQRLVLSSISRIDPRHPIPSAITITAKEFADTFSISENKAYEALEEAADRLFEREISIFNDRGEKMMRKRWVEAVEYREGEGAVVLSFARHITPYLSKLNSRFTSYKLKYVSHLRSIYAIRLFEMLMQFKNTGVMIIDIDAFRERLDLGQKYSRFSNLKARVITPAIKELKTINGLDVTYEAMKEGRTITRLKFDFKVSNQMILDLH